MVRQYLPDVSMHPSPVITWVPGCYRPTGLCSLSWSFSQRPAESCRKQLLGYTSLTHGSKKSCSLWNHFCDLYGKQKLCEHKASAICVTLWSVKILINLVYYSCIAIFIVHTGYFLLLSLKIISMCWHSLLIFNNDGKLLYIDVL